MYRLHGRTRFRLCRVRRCFRKGPITLMKRVPITLENETTTPVGRVDLRVTRQNASKMSGYGGSAPNPTYKSRLLFHNKQ
uniref:Uncharacterized protein n=1 Tax=Candidatus Kentrum sp. LPFa TaxID=2126335 RepID=A0A450Y389_9GAMM|nr:MAG: hypothetical protein BECKLPF1236C_GA0070990_104662 [Candidatus Kentron sp. LPFa]